MSMMNQLRRSALPLTQILMAASIFCAGRAPAQTAVPRFGDYPVNERFAGKTAPLFRSREARMYRTRLSEAAHENPNFAGHFIVSTWGCGTECVMGAIINACHSILQIRAQPASADPINSTLTLSFSCAPQPAVLQCVTGPDCFWRCAASPRVNRFRK